MTIAAIAAGVVLGSGSLAGRSAAQTGSAPPQFLPVGARWCLAGPGRPALATAAAPRAQTPAPKPASTCLDLEVPAGPRQYSWGLQLRPRLPALRGMWFRFEPAQVARFWMHRTPEPLDMVFVRQGKVIAIESAAPCMRLPCRSYGPEQEVDGVVELAAGETARLGIEVGDAALIQPLPAAAP